MNPVLFSGDATVFTGNGIAELVDCTRCIVTEERNGIFECEFDYPVTGQQFSAINEGCIVVATHDDRQRGQPFDIYARSAPLDGIVTFYARHISYRLSSIILRPFTANSCYKALNAFKTENYNGYCPFTFGTDKTITGTYTIDAPCSIRSMLAGTTGSILDVYGTGEYEFDRWSVYLHLHRGENRGVSIRYGVNLTALRQQTDYGDIYTALAPYWRNPTDNTVVMLSEGYVISGTVPITDYLWTDSDGNTITDNNGNEIEVANPKIEIRPIDLSNEFLDEPTEDQLRTRALELLTSSAAWLPKENIEISFVDLSKTLDYADVAQLQTVRLCDTVNVYCGPLGVSAVEMKVIKTVYDVLTESYDSIELGDPSATYADTLLGSVDSIITNRIKDVPTKTAMMNAIDNATNLITGAENSHVVFKYDDDGGLQEILIMDTDDIETAQEVWRWNSGGLGHSHNGYPGPYETAITQDGSIVADFITAGTMLANRIKGGMLTLGNVDGEDGRLQVLDAEGNVIGSWDKDSGLDIKRGQIQLRANENFGLNIGPYGDIAVGAKPDDLSSFEDNDCQFQVNNHGTVKAEGIHFYMHYNGSEHRIKLGTLRARDWYGEPAVMITDDSDEAKFAVTPTHVRVNGQLKVDTMQVSDGASGTFTTANGKTVTVTNGIITSIS